MLYNRLKALRNEAGLSQVKLAKELSMHTTTYVRYEYGERDLPMGGRHPHRRLLSRQPGLPGRPQRGAGTALAADFQLLPVGLWKTAALPRGLVNRATGLSTAQNLLYSNRTIRQREEDCHQDG